MPEKVLDLFDTMLIKPNAHSLSVLFTACGQVNNERAKKISGELLKQMPRESRKDIVLLSSVLCMLMNFGEIEKAENWFASIESKNIVTYGAMMQGKHSSFNLINFQQMSSRIYGP